MSIRRHMFVLRAVLASSLLWLSEHASETLGPERCLRFGC
jgi:hypothetical protein